MNRLQNMPTARTKSKQPRILFVGEALALAHVGRPAMLAAWAQQAGYDVHMACDASGADVVRAENLHPLNLFTVPKETVLDRISRGDFFYTLEELDRYVKADTQLVAQIKPDLVVSDFRLTMDIATQRLGVRQLSLINAHWSPASTCRIPPPSNGFFGALPLPLSRALFALMRSFSYRYFPRNLDTIRRAYGLKALGDFRKHYSSGTYCAYLDIPELEPLPGVPQGHFYLGPLFWKPKNRPSINWEKLRHGSKPTRSLAYVSMGSTGDTKILPLIFRTLMEMNFDVVVSGIPTKTVATWSTTKTHTDRWVAGLCFDPESMLRHASLTICHGGSGTVYQSLSHGVPLVCIPNNPDQCLVADAVESAGVGIQLPATQVTAGHFKTVVGQAINNTRLHQTVQNLSKVLSTWQTKARWLNWLRSHLGKPTPLPTRKTATTDGHSFVESEMNITKTIMKSSAR